MLISGAPSVAHAVPFITPPVSHLPSRRTVAGPAARLERAIVALLLAIISGAWLRHERRRQGRIMVTAALAVGVAALLLAGIFAIAFEAAFLAFHAVFFPPGTYLFSEGSELIVLFPEPFWFDASLAAGAAIVVTALIVSAIGFARWRGGSDPRRAP